MSDEVHIYAHEHHVLISKGEAALALTWSQVRKLTEELTRLMIEAGITLQSSVTN
jgi:hypothetical protein